MVNFQGVRNMDLQKLYDNKRNWTVFTKDNIQDYQEASNECGNARLITVEEVHAGFVELLNDILAESSDPDSLRTNLQEFIQERKEFTEWLSSKWNDVTDAYEFQ